MSEWEMSEWVSEWVPVRELLDNSACFPDNDDRRLLSDGGVGDIGAVTVTVTALLPFTFPRTE